MKPKYQKSLRNSFSSFIHSDLFRILRQGSRQVSKFELRISFVSIRSTVHALAVLFLVLALAGCGSTPPSHFYKLSASGGTAKNSSNISVAVGPVSIPALVDRPQMVISTGPNQVRLEEFDRWASPLQNDIARVIAENLTVLLDTPRVTLFPESTSAVADYRAIVDVQRFDSVPGDAASLDAVWLVRRMKDGSTEEGRTSVREPVQSKDYEELAAAHSRAITRLSQEIAEAVRALDRAGAN